MDYMHIHSILKKFNILHYISFVNRGNFFPSIFSSIVERKLGNFRAFFFGHYFKTLNNARNILEE